MTFFLSERRKDCIFEIPCLISNFYLVSERPAVKIGIRRLQVGEGWRNVQQRFMRNGPQQQEFDRARGHQSRPEGYLGISLSSGPRPFIKIHDGKPLKDSAAVFKRPRGGGLTSYVRTNNQ